jgi:hypothetical protein
MVGHPHGQVEIGFAPVAGLGLRAARDFDAVELCLGLDSRLRLSKLSAGKQEPIVATDLTASFSFGVSFLDSRRGGKRK